jgi:hypothetical protein
LWQQPLPVSHRLLLLPLLARLPLGSLLLQLLRCLTSVLLVPLWRLLRLLLRLLLLQPV